MKSTNYSLTNSIDTALTFRKDIAEGRITEEDDTYKKKAIILKTALIRLKEGNGVTAELIPEIEKLGIKFSYKAYYEPLTQYRIEREDYSDDAPDIIDVELQDYSAGKEPYDKDDILYLKQSVKNMENIPGKFIVSSEKSIRKSDILGTLPEETFYWIHYIMEFSRGGQKIVFYSDMLREILGLPLHENEIEREKRLGKKFDVDGIDYDIIHKKKLLFVLQCPKKYNL